MIRVSVEGEIRACTVKDDTVVDGFSHVIVKTNADSRDDIPEVIIAFDNGRDAYIGALAIDAAERASGYRGPKRFKAGPIIK